MITQKTINKPVYDVVSYEEICVYETTDGKQFEYEDEAKEHQVKLKHKHKIIKTPSDYFDTFYATNKSDLDEMEKCLNTGYYLLTYEREKFQYPNWFVSYIEVTIDDEENRNYAMVIKSADDFAIEISDIFKELYK